MGGSSSVLVSDVRPPVCVRPAHWWLRDPAPAMAGWPGGTPRARSGLLGGRAGGPSRPLSARRWIAAALAPDARPARIAAMLLGIIALSLADLYMTLLHLLNFGMIEANPIARRVMEHGGQAELIVWKLSSIAFAVVVLFWFRRRRASELAAGLCLVVLGALMVQWFAYNSAIPGLVIELHGLTGVEVEGWVSFTEGR